MENTGKAVALHHATSEGHFASPSPYLTSPRAFDKILDSQYFLTFCGG